ncbi:alpha/beta-hydrolase, partial [Gonapodya prolifera JEL478]
MYHPLYISICKSHYASPCRTLPPSRSALHHGFVWRCSGRPDWSFGQQELTLFRLCTCSFLPSPLAPAGRRAILTMSHELPHEVIVKALGTIGQNANPADPSIHIPETWQQEEEVIGMSRQALGLEYETNFKQQNHKERLIALREMLAATPAPPMEIKDGIRFTPVVIPRSSVEGLVEISNPGDVLAGEWVEAGEQSDGKGVVLFIHGGGMTLGTIKSNRDSTQEIALRGLKVLIIDYHLSPEAQYPTSLMDCVNAYKWLLEENKVPASNIVISGDSAGGNLTIALAYYIRDHGLPSPAGIAPLTPWVDLTLSAPTVKSNNPTFNACMLAPVNKDFGGWLPDCVRGYAGEDRGKDNKLVNLLLDDVNPEKHLPPMFLSTGTVDRFLSETLAFFIKRAQGGEHVHIVIFEHGAHVFQIAIGSPASTQFFDDLGRFIRDAIAKARTVQTSSFTFVSAGPDVDYSPHTSLTIKDAKLYLKGLINAVKEEGATFTNGSEYIYEELAV